MALAMAGVEARRMVRRIRVRWRGPILIALLIVGFVVFVLTGPDYNQRLVLEGPDGSTYELCAARSIVGDGGIEPDDDGALPGVVAGDRPHWLDADPPSTLEIRGPGRVTFFDEDGQAFDRGRGEAWSSAFVEDVGTGQPSPVALDARGGC